MWGCKDSERVQIGSMKVRISPLGSIMRVKAKQKERAIGLGDIHSTLISDLFQTPLPLPGITAFDMKLRRRSRRVLQVSPVNNGVGTTMIYIQPDAEDAFSEVRKYMKKLDFRMPQGKGLKETVGRNLDYMVCSDRDLNPGHRLERPECLAVLHHRSFLTLRSHNYI